MKHREAFPVAGAPLGAIAGALVGFAVARNPAGAVVGALVGHLFQKTIGAQGRGASSSVRAALRAGSLVELAVSVARVDGPMVHEERESIRSYFHRDAGLPPKHVSTINTLIEEAEKTADVAPEEAADALPPLDAADSVHVLFVLFRIALADRSLTTPEEQALRRVAEKIGFSDRDFAAIREHFVISAGVASEEDDYRNLGLEPDATQDEVKESYRKAAKAYHPDKFRHLGDEFTSVAEEKFKKINESYERISGGRGRSIPTESLSVCGHCRVFSSVETTTCPRCNRAKFNRLENEVLMRCPFCTQNNALPETAMSGTVRCGNCKVLLIR